MHVPFSFLFFDFFLWESLVMKCYLEQERIQANEMES